MKGFTTLRACHSNSFGILYCVDSDTMTTHSNRTQCGGKPGWDDKVKFLAHLFMVVVSVCANRSRRQCQCSSSNSFVELVVQNTKSHKAHAFVAAKLLRHSVNKQTCTAPIRRAKQKLIESRMGRQGWWEGFSVEHSLQTTSDGGDTTAATEMTASASLHTDHNQAIQPNRHNGASFKMNFNFPFSITANDSSVTATRTAASGETHFRWGNFATS